MFPNFPSMNPNPFVADEIPHSSPLGCGSKFPCASKLWIAASFFVAHLLCAQIQVDLQLGDQKQFLPSEPIPVKVSIVNQSGRTLKFATRPDWLLFSVESYDGRGVAKIREVPVEGEFELDSATRGSFTVNIAPHFTLAESGRFRLTAQVFDPSQSSILTTSGLVFEIIQGTRIWVSDFGIASSVPSEAPEQRKYLLQQVNHLKHLGLYVRVTDAQETKTFALERLGTLVSFNKPEPVIDRQSRLHVLHQFGSRMYAYHVVDPHGRLLERKFYEIGESRPKMRVNEIGEILVIGGVRRPGASDLPLQETKNALSPENFSKESVKP